MNLTGVFIVRWLWYTSSSTFRLAETSMIFPDGCCCAESSLFLPETYPSQWIQTLCCIDPVTWRGKREPVPSTSYDCQNLTIKLKRRQRQMRVALPPRNKQNTRDTQLLLERGSIFRGSIFCDQVHWTISLSFSYIQGGDHDHHLDHRYPPTF